MRYATVIGIVVLLAVGIFVAQGCDMGDLFRVKTPSTLIDDGLPASMTLNEAESRYEAKLVGMRQWKDSIERGWLFADTLSGLAMQQLTPYLGPLLGPAAPIGGLLAGWFLLRRPGDKSKKDGEKAYNKGLDIGAKKVTEALSSIKGG